MSRGTSIFVASPGLTLNEIEAFPGISTTPTVATCEVISKPMNLGNLIRSAHAFGARFFFTVGAAAEPEIEAVSDTARSPTHLPLYRYGSPAELTLPEGCKLVGVEILDEAIELPNFPHPLAAAYVLGPERGRLSPPMIARCEHIVRIPSRFSINVGVAPHSAASA